VFPLFGLVFAVAVAVEVFGDFFDLFFEEFVLLLQLVDSFFEGFLIF
jgi:hypothetical protein